MKIFQFYIKKRFIFLIPAVLVCLALIYVVFIEENNISKTMDIALKTKAEFTINGFKLFETLAQGQDWNLKADIGDVYKEESKAYLKGISVTFYNNDGKVFRLTSSEAELDLETKITILSGEVRASSDDSYTLITTKATLYPDEQKLMSDEAITITGPDITITGNGYEGYLKTKYATIKNNVVTLINSSKDKTGLINAEKKKSAPIKLKITAQKGTFDMIKNQATYVNNVKGSGNGFILEADNMIIDYNLKGENRSIKQIICNGDVKINKDGREAQGEKAVLITANEQLTLTGDPSIKDGPSFINGDKIIYNYKKDTFEIAAAKGTYNKN